MEIVTRQKQWFKHGYTQNYEFRKQQLLKMKRMLQTFEVPLLKALQYDLNKSEFEAYTTEIAFLNAEIQEQLSHLKKRMAPEKVKAPLSHTGTQNYIRKEPYGSVLIIAPWNYPLQLAIAPAIGALAAGNTAVLKPSEMTPTVSWVIRRMIEEFFPEHVLKVVEGGKEVTQQLLSEPFDYIFFTGSERVGKIVMQKASEQLIPVTLELGGKSPAIVHKDANLPVAARRIAWGKLINAGQTCIAPDHVYVHKDIKEAFIREYKAAVHLLYGKEPLKNDDFVKIVSKDHFDRIKSYLSDGNIALGGETDEKNNKIAPAVLTEVTEKDPVMQEEIFGPILPVLEYRELQEAVETISDKPDPLALYYFGEDEKSQEFVTTSLSFGGGCINDTLYHIINPHLPFGGIGASGMGSYHGKFSFETFTHKKSITKQNTKFDPSFRYKRDKNSLKIIKRIL
ncbi:aldehyde dehydrogenase [Salimicrobium humidisoli]|uniref:Aldehyde dehydrogenase n=1 Tax=Salimicrobium humidisoli TaxID=2029857 RepID=A0ABX4HPA9_9BACI|nr:aldehyde dehydrogenase [Salimicrobium humidisoli]PBB05047.1 aldehyde dehydrogenase family protein [Salimicrobium humidisoli]